MRTTLFPILLLICCSSVSIALARVWTDSSGKYTIEAELLRVHGNVVHLKKNDGRVVQLPIERLSDSDRQYVQTYPPQSKPTQKAATPTAPHMSSQAPAPRSNDPANVASFYEKLGAQLARTEEGLLVQMTLAGENFDDATMAYLRHLPDLSTLYLAETKVTNKGLRHLRDLTQLRELVLAKSSIDDHGLSALANLKNLRSLCLLEPKISDEGLRLLLPLDQLKFLMIAGERITDGGMRELAKMKSIEIVLAMETKVSNEGAEQLFKALPTVELVSKVDGNNTTTIWKKSAKNLPDVPGLDLTTLRFPGWDLTLRPGEYVVITKGMPHIEGVFFQRVSPNEDRNCLFRYQLHENGKPAYIAEMSGKAGETYERAEGWWPNGQRSILVEPVKIRTAKMRHTRLWDSKDTMVGDVIMDPVGSSHSELRVWDKPRIVTLVSQDENFKAAVTEVLVATVQLKKATDSPTATTALTGYDVAVRARDVITQSKVDLRQKHDALRQITVVFATLGSVEGTSDTVKIVREAFAGDLTDIILREAAECMANSGNPNEAKRLARDLSGHDIAAVLAHSAIAYAKARNGKQALADVERALRHMQKAEVAPPGFEATVDVARAAASLGMLEDAIKIAESGSVPELSAKSGIIAVLVEENRVKEATQLFQKIPASSPYAGAAAVSLASGYARRGDFDSARKVMDVLPAASGFLLHRIRILGAMAAAASRAKDQARSRKLLNEAAILVDSFERPISTTLLCYLVEAQVAGGEIDRALERVAWVEHNLNTLRKGTESGLEVDVPCALALLQIAELKTQSGELDAAKMLTNRAERLLTVSTRITRQRGEALRKLGQAWVQLASSPNAVKRSEYLNAATRAYVLAGIAEALGKREQAAEGKKL